MKWSKVEDAPGTPREIYGWRVYLLAITASCGALLFGYDTGVIGGVLALPSFIRDFGTQAAHLSKTEKAAISANIVSTFQGGTFFGAAFTYPITEVIGRRWTLLIAAVVFCVGSAMQTWADGSLPLIYAGRAVGGLGVGSSSLLVPVYMSEISPPAIRGKITGIFEISLQFGALLGFWINYACLETISDVGYAQWQVPLGLQLLPGVILAVGCLFIMKESPRWLLSKGRTDEALRNLAFVRNLPIDHPYLQAEMADVQAQIDHELAIAGGSGFLQKLKECTFKGNRNRIAIGAAMMMFQNLSGINAINYYSTTIFASVGVTGTKSKLLSTGVYAVVKTATTIFAMLFLVDQLGRKPLLLAGSVGGGLAMLYIGCFIRIAKPDAAHPVKSPAATAALAMIYIFASFYCMSWNAIAWIVCSEIFPVKIRTLCVTITTMCQWFWQFVIARSTPYMFAYSTFFPYFLFASCMALAFAWVWFVLPETKGRTLESMDLLFGARSDGDNHLGTLAGPKGVVDEENGRPLAHYSSAEKGYVTEQVEIADHRR